MQDTFYIHNITCDKVKVKERIIITNQEITSEQG